MTDERKTAQYNAEMAAHANGTAQFFDALIGGRFVIQEQAYDMTDYVSTPTKRNLESCPLLLKKKRMLGYGIGRI